MAVRQERSLTQPAVDWHFVIFESYFYPSLVHADKGIVLRQLVGKET